MTKLYAGIVILILCIASCTPFERLHYRHIHKVPAVPQAYAPRADRANTTPAPIAGNHEEEVAPVIPDSVVCEFKETTAVSVPMIVKDSAVASDSAVPLKIRAREILLPSSSLPHDYSLLIASLMIIAAMMLILYGIYLVPYFNMVLLVRILIELLIGIVAIKLLISGFAIFRNRFREKKTYKETQ